MNLLSLISIRIINYVDFHCLFFTKSMFIEECCLVVLRHIYCKQVR